MLDWFPLPTIGAPGDARALSQAELQARWIAQQEQMTSSHPYRGSLAALLQNYRPPVHVPQGWVDWYATGDEIL